MSDKAEKQSEDLSVIGSRTLQRETKDVLDRIQDSGEPVVIFRHGRPAAALVPIDETQARALALASSPEIRARRTEAAKQPPSEPQLFAVSEEDAEGEGELAVAIDETNKYLQSAVEVLGMEEVGQFEETFGVTGADPELGPSLVEIHRRNARVLVDLVQGFREQTETLTALASRESTEEQAEAEEEASA